MSNNILPQKQFHGIFKLAIALIFLGALGAGCASTPAGRGVMGTGVVTATGAAGFDSPHNLVHVVGPSETLWRIGKTYNVDINTLLKANHLSDPTKIKNGQRLLIPQTTGARPVIPLYPTKRWTHIVIHHTATHEGDAFMIDELHHKRGFWNGLGYHFLINNGTNGKEDGQIQVGPRWIKQLDGAHANADGMNQKGIGIVIVGNFSQSQLTGGELESAVMLVKTLQKYYGIPSGNVIRHSDVPGKNTECPGLKFPWREFRQRLSR